MLIRAVRYDDIYRVDEIKSLSFHIMFYRLFRVVAKYIIYGNTFSLFEWLRSLYTAHHEAWRGDRTSQDTTRSFLSTAVFKQPILSRLNSNNRAICVRRLCVREAHFFFFADYEQLHKHIPRLSDLGLQKE